MASGAVSLADYPGDAIVVACTKCERRGRYRKALLIAAHGPAISLPTLLREISANCPRRAAASVYDGCGAHYPGLEQLR